MKTAQQWNQEYQKLGSTRDMPEWIVSVQMDAWRTGMTDAAQIVQGHWSDTISQSNQFDQAQRSALAILKARDNKTSL